MAVVYPVLLDGRFIAGTEARPSCSSGYLRPDVSALDIAWLIEQFSRRAPAPLAPAPLAPAESAEDRNVRSRLVAIALAGLHTGPADALPGRPPTLARYVDRWSAKP